MKTTICQMLGVIVALSSMPAQADVLAQWTFNSGANSTLRLASSSVARGAFVSGLSLNDSFTNFGPGAVPNDVHDGFGFGGASGDQVIFLHRATYFDDSEVPDPRPTADDYTSWGTGAEQGTGANMTANGNAPISFTVTGDAISTVTIDSLTVDFTSAGNTIFQFQEAGASPGVLVTVMAPQDESYTVPLDEPVVIGPGQTKTFTINLNSGSLNSFHNIDGIALNGSVVRDTSIPALAQWTFDTGATSSERLASSSVVTGAAVSGLSIHDSFTDFGPGAVPNDVHDGFGFGEAIVEETPYQVIFLHRANYFDSSAVPDPRPTVDDYTTWGLSEGTGANLTANGNASIVFTVTAEPESSITVNSLTVDFNSGAAIVWAMQEAGALRGGEVTANATNPLVTVALRAPVVIAPGETRTFTINLNSGNLNSAHNINGLTINGTVGSGADPYTQWAVDNGLAEGVNDGFDENPDFDPFPNGLEWILGGTTPLGFDGVGIGSTGELLNTEVDGSGDLVFTFQRIDESEGEATPKVQLSNDLFVSDNHDVAIGASGPDGVPPVGVTVDIVENGSAPDDVTVTIPASYGQPDGRLFGRLSATRP